VTTGLLDTAALAASFLVMERLNLEYAVLSEPGTCARERRQNTTIRPGPLPPRPFMPGQAFLCHAAWAQPASEQQATEMDVGRWMAPAASHLGGDSRDHKKCETITKKI